MKTKQPKRTLTRGHASGFTIIEVLIVLAIAGLILLIVFLAVPALQRNARNTQRKNDVAGLLGAVAEFSNNNNGTLPNTCSGTSPATFDTTPTTGTTSQAKLGYYNQGCHPGTGTATANAYILAGYAATGPLSTTTPNDYVTLVPAARCNGGQTTAGSARQWAAVYQIETGAGTFGSICQES